MSVEPTIETDYVEITSVTEDPVEVDSSPGPVSDGDPFPELSDRQLEELREDTRQQLITLGSPSRSL